MPNASIFAESGRIVTKVAICLATITCVQAYTSSQSVKVAHSIPHLTKLLELQSSDFGLTSASTGGDKYFLSLMTLPVLLMVVGIFGLSTFGAILISRICWSCAVNAPYRKEVKEESDEEYSGWSRRIIKCRRFLLTSFIVFLMLAFTSTQVGWYGYTRFDVGISGISKSYDSLFGTFSSLQTQGTALQVSSEAIQSKIKTSSCYLARNADAVRAFKYSESLGLACSAITSETASVTDSLAMAGNPIQTYAFFIRKIAFYVSYAFISMLCLLLATFVAFRLKLPTQATFFLTYVVVSILTIASCGIMIIVMAMSDFCMDPRTSLNTFLMPMETERTFAEYYTSCAGSDPLLDTYASASNATVLLRGAMVKLLSSSSSCRGDSNLVNVLQNLPPLSNRINSLKDSVSCSSVMASYKGGVEVSLCKDVFEGLFSYWLGLCCIATCLFLCLIFLSLLWQYFNPLYWNLDSVKQKTEDDCDDDEGLDSSYSFREEGRGIRESYTYDERDLDPESWKQSELGPEYKSGSEPISEPFLKPMSVSKRNSKIFTKPVQEQKKIILLDSGSKPDNDYLFESVSELDIEVSLQSVSEPKIEVLPKSVSEPNNEPYHESGLEPAKVLLFEPVSEPDIGHLFESGSEYDSDSESEYTDLGLHMTDFDMPPTDSMKRELSSFEMLVTVENERKRQAKMAEQARVVEVALPTADSIKASRGKMVCVAPAAIIESNDPN